MSSKFITIYVDRNQKTSLFRQVYEKIRDHILSGFFKPGTRLPPTRSLAKELNLSRNVVMEAYDQLHAEGYIESSQGSYTQVAKNTCYKGYSYKPPAAEKPEKKNSGCDIEFRTGIPDLNLFPRAAWGKYLKAAVMEAKDAELSYYEPEGHLGLREELSAYLYRAKGIKVDPSRIVITNGATQALSLAAGILHQDLCEAVIEDPGGYGVIQILEKAGYHLNPVRAGNKGIFSSGIKMSPHIRMIYITPSHQFPMGSILPAASRIELLDLIRDKDIYIVEDDYDSEFRYDGPPIYPVKALDPEKVIYIGSFSKVLSPALRIGYSVLPAALVGQFKQKKHFTDAQSPMMDQIALMKFIKDGLFEKHVHKMKKVYKRKRDVLVNVLLEEFKDSIRIYGENAGLHLVIEFKETTLPVNGRFEVCHNGVFIHSVEKHALEKGRHGNKLIFGYGNLSEAEIISGIRKLEKFKPCPADA